MEFWRYYRVLRRRRWLILGLAVVLVAGVALTESRGSLDYEATAILTDPTLGEQRSPDEAGVVGQVAVILNLISRRTVAERVVRKLNLTTNPGDLQLRTSAEADPSGDIRVSVTAKNPTEAIALANAVAEVAAAYHREVSAREATATREFLERRVEEVQGDLRKAEDALLDFRRRSQFYEQPSLRLGQVATLDAELLQTDLALKENAARQGFIQAQITRLGTRLAQQVVDTPITQHLRGQLVELEVALTSEEAIHTPRHPNVVAMRARIEAVKDRLNRELSKGVPSDQSQPNPARDALVQNQVSLETEKLALQARRNALQRVAGTARRELSSLSRKELDQTRLARNMQILETQFVDLATRLNEARIREKRAQYGETLTVAEVAKIARPAPIQGRRMRLALATLLGLMGAVGLALFLDYVDDSFKTPDEAERRLGVQALATVPRHNPPFGEVYRLLRVNLAAKLQGIDAAEGIPVITVTSPKPGTGVSTVVANLSQAFAETGRRTIIIDAAYHRPTLHTLFSVRNERGLAEILEGKAALENVLVQTRVSNLWLLPSGMPPKEASGLLGSKAMPWLLAELRKRSDVILIDTNSAGAFSDALAVAPLTSGVLLVQDAGRAPRGVEDQVKAQLARVGAKVLGVVLNKMKPDLVDSYFYHEQFFRAKRHWGFSRPAVVAAAVLVLVLAGIFVEIYMKSGNHAGPLLVTGPVVQRILRAPVHWLFDRK